VVGRTAKRIMTVILEDVSGMMTIFLEMVL